MVLTFLNGVSLWDCVLRVVFACFCGALIGFERSRRQKEAGIRTHIIVALGAALMMVVSKYGFYDIVGENAVGFSGDRVAANIITGVSFLGAGMIFFRGSTVRGLTTAAGIWSTAGVGLAIGSGLYILGGVSTCLILIIQIIFHKWRLSADMQIYGTVVVSLEYDEERIGQIEETLLQDGIEVISNRMERLDGDQVKIQYNVQSNYEVSARQAANLFRVIPELLCVEVHSEV